MTYEATTVAEYVAALPEDRREPFSRLLDVARTRLPDGFVEQLAYGMPAFVVPHSMYPAGYHCDPKQPLPFLSFGNQKNYIAVYHSGIYTDAALSEWFVAEWTARVKVKLDMGKSCIRLKKIDAIPYDLFGDLFAAMTVDDWVRAYEAATR
jgi:hypothetical protein